MGAALNTTSDWAARRCARCIFPDSLPGIEFTDDGTCNHCQTYEAP